MDIELFLGRISPFMVHWPLGYLYWPVIIEKYLVF